MNSYSIPYILFLFVLYIGHLVESSIIRSKIKTFAVASTIAISYGIFFGLRGFVMTDWITYHEMFSSCPILFSENYWTKLNYAFDGRELGFSICTSIVKTLIPNYFFWVFFNSIVNVFALLWIAHRYTRYMYLFFIVFMCFDGAALEINLMRNIKSILFFLISIECMIKRSSIKYFFFNILGFFFHVSSILYLPLYSFLRKKWNKKLIICLFIAVFPFVFGFNPVINFISSISNIIGGRIGTTVSFYLLITESSFGISIGLIERLLTFLAVLTIYNRDTVTSSIRVFLNIFLIYFFSSFIFNFDKIICQRIMILFISGYWILYPFIYSLLEKRMKFAFVTLLVIYGSAKMYVGYTEANFKYSNILIHDVDYDREKKNNAEK